VPRADSHYRPVHSAASLRPARQLHAFMGSQLSRGGKLPAAKAATAISSGSGQTMTGAQIAKAFSSRLLSHQVRQVLNQYLLPAVQQWTRDVNRGNCAAMLVQLSTWPASAKQVALPAIAQSFFEGRTGLGADEPEVLFDAMLKFDTTAGSESAQTLRGTRMAMISAATMDEKVRALQSFVAETANRPSLFRSLALQGALELSCNLLPTTAAAPQTLGDRGVRTAMFEAVAAQPSSWKATSRIRFANGCRRALTSCRKQTAIFSPARPAPPTHRPARVLPPSVRTCSLRCLRWKLRDVKRAVDQFVAGCGPRQHSTEQRSQVEFSLGPWA
jgi:hypothetical protein